MSELRSAQESYAAALAHQDVLDAAIGALDPQPPPTFALRVQRDCPGHHPRSLYVERFWLPIVGPTAWLLWRALVEHGTDPAVVLTEITARFGVPAKPAAKRSVDRLVHFGLAVTTGTGGTVWVCDAAPTQSPGRLRRLPVDLQLLHQDYEDA